MQRIYFVYSYYGVGGAQRRSAILANELVKHGYRVSILAIYGKDSSIVDDKNYYNLVSNVDLILLPNYIQENYDNKRISEELKKKEKKRCRLKKAQHFFHRYSKICGAINNELRKTHSSKYLAAFFEINEPGIVICFGFNIFEQVFTATKRKNKVVYAETNSIHKYENDRNFFDTLKLIKRANAIVFQTQQQKNDLCVKSNYFIIHNPINPDLPVPYNGKRKKIIVNFCALKRHKNLQLLIKAFLKLISENSQFADYKLYLYSDKSEKEENKENSYRTELKKLIKENSLENSVIILPMVSDIHKIISDCSLYVSSSDYEGISNSMIEAMAIGLPCVCTDCDGGGAREFIVDGYNGLLVEKGNEAALAFAMERMLSDSKLSKKCSENAKKIRDELSIDNIIKQWIVVLNSLSGKQMEM